nr:uncharacterized protein LOC111416533 isoform X1 [Onthophagus taurus]
MRDEVNKKNNKMPNKKRRGGSDTKHAKGSSKGGGGGGTLTNNKTEKKPVKTDKNRHDLDDNKSNTERRRTYSNNKKTSNNTTTTNNSSSNCDEVDATVTIRHDVVVNLNNRTAIVSDVKRYSDSFIQAGCNKIDKIDGNLSRSRSGFLTDDDKESPKSDKSDRKSRRFSDIFRYGAYRTDLDVIKNQEERKKMISSSSGDTKKGKINNTVKSATGNRNLAMVGGTPNKPEKTLSTCSDSNNSYLKRVKSKICRTRTDDPSTIYENDENLKQRNNLRSSVSHFDFRLIRQTSNLEKVVRPSVLGHKKCASNVGVGETISDEKPVLAKSKSSSAINLGLLRTRRNKILEQIKKNVKPAENEFDFIAFTRSHRDKNDFIEESVQTTLPKTTSSGNNFVLF